ncbi:DEAD (Asp-Glu-Ala-Asp) box polypeptide 20 [Gryganskiella cystojenkinii]|nr:DEAD (Asp-Glu-Ala-Asp) box polypeptide 20 [Gryganskiella cystojenkinii]
MTTLDRFHSSDVRISEDLDFSSLVSNQALLKGLVDSGYQRPSPIQLKTIPLGRLGLDLIAQAKSGTGKTIVFSVIAIEAVLSSTQLRSRSSINNQKLTTEDSPDKKKSIISQSPRAVIVAPTREIAVQIQEVILNLVQSELQEAVTCHAMIGGMPIAQDKQNLNNCSIVVGTPGRVKSLIDTGHLKTDQIRLLVLDEADKLMESTFKNDIIGIAKGLGPVKQVMAFSATYDDDLLAELDHLVKNPVYVMLTDGTPELEGVLQYYKVAQLDEKQKKGSVFLKQNYMTEAKFAELEGLFTHVPFYQAMVFLNHRGRASDLVTFLNKRGWPAMHITSGISQKERLDIMSKTRKFELRVLVCSDLIARGIDIDRVNLVVNLDLPKDPETYLHRIGRTGRYGTTGLAVSIVDNSELKTVQILQKEYHLTMQELSNRDRTFSELTHHSKNRHHERPLQAPEDKDQFEKLESERIEREGYVPSESEDENDENQGLENDGPQSNGQEYPLHEQEDSEQAEGQQPYVGKPGRSRKRQRVPRSPDRSVQTSSIHNAAKRQRKGATTSLQVTNKEQEEGEEDDKEEEEVADTDDQFYCDAEQLYNPIPNGSASGGLGYDFASYSSIQAQPRALPPPQQYYPFHPIMGEYTSGRYGLPWSTDHPFAYYPSPPASHPSQHLAADASSRPSGIFFPPDLFLFPPAPI